MLPIFYNKFLPVKMEVERSRLGDHQRWVVLLLPATLERRHWNWCSCWKQDVIEENQVQKLFAQPQTAAQQAARAHLEALLPALAAEESGAEAPRRLELLSGLALGSLAVAPRIRMHCFCAYGVRGLATAFLAAMLERSEAVGKADLQSE